MSSSSDEEEAIVAAMCCGEVSDRRYWTHNINLRREDHGEQHHLFPELSRKGFHF